MSEFLRAITLRRKSSIETGRGSQEQEQHDLVQQLLNEAHIKFGGDNFESYKQYKGYGEKKGNLGNKFAVPLPDKYAPLLLGDNPHRYQIVSYIDYRDRQHWSRRDERHVMLSSASTRFDAGDNLGELEYEQVDGKIFLEVGEYLHQSYLPIYGNESRDMTKPEGDAKAKYELQQDGIKKLLDAHVRRCDDVVLPGGQKGRWSRYFSLENEGYMFDTHRPIEYSDHYGIEGEEDHYATIKFSFAGTLEKPKRITIQIGNALGDTQLVRSLDGRVRVITNDHNTDQEAELAFLQQEPSYSFLFKDGKLRRPSFSEVHDFVLGRINQLQHDWNNPNNVFLGRSLDASTRSVIQADPFHTQEL